MLDITDLTDGTVDGTGVFDQLMKAAKAHVDSEYEKNRIKGAEYATVYLGTIQSAMAQSIQYMVSQPQIEKTQAEIDLLEQRRKTEIAQILDQVDGVDVTGVIGKQKTLYQAQTDGFARDAEQKMAKLMSDVWSVQRTTDEGISPAGAGISDAEIKKVIDKAKQGINVT